MSPLRLGVSAWAREWGVHRNTARMWLRRLHDQYGDRVVEKRTYGDSVSYWASRASLAKLDVQLPEQLVTQAQFGQALSEIWRAIESIRRTQTPKCTATAR